MEWLVLGFLILVLIHGKVRVLKKGERGRRKPPTDYSGDDWGW